jgi:L-alanine-DL-glutamate epimerase-like enolase superfamily enzyme
MHHFQRVGEAISSRTDLSRWAAFSRRSASAKRRNAVVLPTVHTQLFRLGRAVPSLHFRAALPQVLVLEFNPVGTAVEKELFMELLIVRNGHVQVPAGPGLSASDG